MIYRILFNFKVELWKKYKIKKKSIFLFLKITIWQSSMLRLSLKKISFSACAVKKYIFFFINI